MRRPLAIESTSAVPLTTDVISQVEPTGDPQWQITATTVTDPEAADWVTGAWSGTWNSTTGGDMTAVSPILGATGFVITEGRQTCWLRWAAGTHTPVFAVGTLYAS